MIKVTIVVPIYKVEKYLNRCLESLVNQTLQDIEIILVDDGSPDNCPIFCDQWKEKDHRIRVVHKQNGGLSSARNAGLDIARGEYIGFVDSDDDIELDMYEKMYQKAKEYNVDFVMSDYLRILNSNEKYIKSLDINEGYYSRNQIVKDIFPQLIMTSSIEYGPLLSVWHCLYKLSFLKNNNIHFDNKVKWSEDNIFSSFVGYHAQSFYYMKNEALYHYYQNEGTITTSYRQGAWNVYKTMNKHLHQYFDKIEDYDFSNQLNYHLIYYASNCLNMCSYKGGFTKIRKEISLLLTDNDLQDALRNVRNLTVSKKLCIQLWLMKHKYVSLLSIMILRRFKSCH